MKLGISEQGFKRLAQMQPKTPGETINSMGEFYDSYSKDFLSRSNSGIDEELRWEVQNAFGTLESLLQFVKSDFLTSEGVAGTEALSLEFLSVIKPLLEKIERFVEDDV